MPDHTSKTIFNVTRGNVLCERAHVAATALTRMRGLLGRRTLPVGDGLFLSPTPSIHTLFMRFPIDAVFVDDDLHVVKLVGNLRPWRAAASTIASSVLEIAPGQAAIRGLSVGDELALVDPESMNVAPRPPAVVLASDDSRFRSVMSMLLSHRGYRVSACSSHVDSAARAVREQSGVVVIDAGGSFEDAAMDAVTLRALCPELGVVLVVDEPRPWIESLPVVMKWGAFGSLFAAIERARTCDFERSPNARTL
jgi:uncharacterized membrane protein (UPF0127 family)/CheY-like chemotaxis protein